MKKQWLSKNVLVVWFLMIPGVLMAQKPQEVNLEKGMGVIGWFIVSFLALITLTGLVTGYHHMGSDQGKAKACFAGAIAVPVIAGFVYYLFKTIFKIDLTFSSTF